VKYETNRLERLFQIRDEQRKKRPNGRTIVRYRDLPIEKNRNGLQRWYMHPDMDDNAIQTLLAHIQELPPGGRSGKQKSQGGQVAFVWEGRGYTLIDGVRYDWDRHDVLNFPVRTDGIVVQHVNLDQENRAQLFICEPNAIDALGVDRGCGFEQIEDAPE
jgi:gentisate 1,2-dioxygenase